MYDLDSVLYNTEYFLQDNICRFCWTKDATINCTLKSPMFFKVEYCLNIDLSQDDSEYCPKKVCQNCFHKIEQFHEFKTFCQNANEKLNIILNNGTSTSVNVLEFSPETIKPENVENSENFELASVESNIDCSQHSESSLENIIKSPRNTESTKESSENKKCSKRVEKAKTLNSHRKSKLQTTNSRVKISYRRKKCSTYCNICCENFFNEDTFIKHNSEAHGIEKDGKFKCFGCGKLHRTRKARLGHEAHFCKQLENGYKCSFCSRYLLRRGMYEKHMRDHRLNRVEDSPEDNIFKCSKCMEQFTKKGDWKVHMEGHAPKKMYVCETCGKVFSRLDYLHKHNVTHTGDRRYVCPHCGFRTTQKNNLTIHIRKHTDERPYPCDLCPQRCVSSSNLRAHRRRHLGLNSFQCSICNKKFGYKLSLKEHIAITHERSQSYPCAHCGSVYARKKGLKRHLQNKHSSDPKEIRQNTAQDSPADLYPNADKTQGTYPIENSENGEEKLHSNQANQLNITENITVQEGNEEFGLKIGEADKFVYFEKVKGNEKIVILLQE